MFTKRRTLEILEYASIVCYTVFLHVTVLVPACLLEQYVHSVTGGESDEAEQQVDETLATTALDHHHADWLRIIFPQCESV